jgi:hypothetical protein
MPSIKIRDGRGGSRMATVFNSSFSKEQMLIAVTAAVEASEGGHNVDLTINQDHIEVFVNAEPATE